MYDLYDAVSAKYRGLVKKFNAAIEARDKAAALAAAKEAYNISDTVAKNKAYIESTRNYYANEMRKWAKEIHTLEGIDEIKRQTDSTSEAKKSTPTIRSDITFKDIAGLDAVKRMLYDKVVMPMKNPDVMSYYKKKPTSTMQILLYGPPGSGKSMFAEALANELDMSVHRALASEIITSLLGGSIKNMRDFMNEIIEDESPRILAFIDEFDALAPKRVDGTQGADSEMNRVVNELLQAIDDMVKSSTNRSIVFLATTNRPWSIDPAILRGKRLDTQIYVGLSDFEARKYLVNRMLGGGVPPLEAGINLDALAKQLKGYSAADISTICDKICDEPMIRHYHTGTPQKVTVEDILKVTGLYKRSVTPEVLAQYHAYNKSRGYDTPELT